MGKKDNSVEIYKAFVHGRLKDGVIDFDFNDKSCQNILLKLYEVNEIRELWDEDVIISFLEKQIPLLFNSFKKSIEKKDFESLADSIIEYLKLYVSNHLIVVPIPHAKFDKLIKFGVFTFIPFEFSDIKKTKILSKLASTKHEIFLDNIDHTIKSRSNDFLKYPLLAVSLNDTTSKIHDTSLKIVKTIIFCLRAYYYGEILKKTESRILRIYRMDMIGLKQATHLAIYSNEDWKQAHRPLDFNPEINFDLTWLTNNGHKKKFSDFVNKLFFNATKDSFNYNFLNALYLLNEAEDLNSSIRNLLYMSVCESIIVKNKNEKRLRLASLIPEILGLKGEEKKSMSELFNSLYHSRNEFVHGAKKELMSSDFSNKLNIARYVISLILIKYVDFNLDLKSNNNFENNCQIRENNWNTFLDNKFKEKLFS